MAMNTAIRAWVNGEIRDAAEVQVSPLSHSFGRASAIFEVMAITRTPSGPAFFCLEEHLARFFESARCTYMELPYTPRELREALFLTARANHITTGVAKFFAYYPLMELGTTPEDPRVDVAIFCLELPLPDLRTPAAPVSAGISRFCKPHPDTMAVHAKVAGNYVNGFLARSEVRRRGFDEALLLDLNGHIAEGPTANVFFVNGSKVETPTVFNVLPGITRAVIMEVLGGIGYRVCERRITPGELGRYSEAFFSGTLNAVQPISRIEDHTFDAQGPLTRALRSTMAAVLDDTLTGCGKWLSHIG